MRQILNKTSEMPSRRERSIVARDYENCGAAETSIEARFSGALLVLFGGALVVGTAGLAFAAGNIAAQIGKLGAPNFFAGTPTQKAIVFAVVVALLVFSALCLIGGISQIATGKRARGLRLVSYLLDSTASFVVESLLFF